MFSLEYEGSLHWEAKRNELQSCIKDTKVAFCFDFIFVFSGENLGHLGRVKNIFA